VQWISLSRNCSGNFPKDEVKWGHSGAAGAGAGAGAGAEDI